MIQRTIYSKGLEPLSEESQIAQIVERRPGFDPRQGYDILFSPQRPHRSWGSNSFLLNGYRGLFRRGKVAGA
jgi:hypothetical protein